MKARIDEILLRAGEQETLLYAAQALLSEQPSRGARWARLCLSASLLLVLTLIPAQCTALL